MPFSRFFFEYLTFRIKHSVPFPFELIVDVANVCPAKYEPKEEEEEKK